MSRRVLSSPRIFVLILTTALLLSCSSVESSAVLGFDYESDIPIPVIEPHGPASHVTALAFDSTGQTLYAGGLDKVVRVWRRTNGDKFSLDKDVAFRVPAGPGQLGSINTIALSSDGQFLAVGGFGNFAIAASAEESGNFIPFESLPKESYSEIGKIYIFNTRNGKVNVLNGHLDAVLEIEFAPESHKHIMVSAALEGGKRILRVWDLKTMAQVSSMDLDQQFGAAQSAANSNIAPQLSLAAIGDQPDIHASIAWENRICDWNLQTGVVHSVQSNTVFSFVASFVPGQNRIFGGVGNVVNNAFDAALSRWNRTENGSWQRDDRYNYKLPKGGIDSIPLALAPIPNRGKSLFASLWAKRNDPNKPFEYVLKVVSAENGLGQQNIPEIKVASNNLRPPVIACSPKGDYLAIGSTGRHEIIVFKVDDIISGNNNAQTIRGVGRQILSASFVRKGNELSLLFPENRLESAVTIKPEDLILDIQRRKFVRAGTNSEWSLANPNSNGWKASVNPARNSIALFRNQAKVREIELSQDRIVTASAIALCNGISVLAVGSDGVGGPEIGLFELDSGVAFRVLNGHTAQISSLSFSDDGKLLISAGQDQFVCVWSLDDFDSVLGKRGLFRAVVSDTENKVIYKKPWPDGRPAFGLNPGDQLVSIVTSDKELDISSSGSLYQYFSRSKPDEVIRLKKSAPTGQIELVDVRVGQMIDERKPLFCLFIAELTDENRAGWIGWSPIGYYESSDLEFEQYLGWHFNTGNKSRPTDFARANQYRGTKSDSGLLARLVRSGKYEPPPDPPPTPKMLLMLPGSPPGTALIRESPSHVRLSVDEFPLDLIQDLHLTMDDKTIAKFEIDADQYWQADISHVSWTRGEHSLTAVLNSAHQRSRQPFRELITVNFVPSPPIIQLEQLNAITTKQREFELKAVVRPSDAAQEFDLRVTQMHQSDSVVLKSESHLTDIVNVSQPVTLKPGKNVFQIRATNRDAAVDANETNEQIMVVIYQPVPAPVFTSVEVQPLNGSISSTNEPRRITTSECRIVANVKTQSPISSASLIHNDIEYQLEVSTLQNELQKIQLNKTLELKPGNNQIKLRGTTHDDKFSETVAVFFEPPLPKIDIVSPRGNITVREAGRKPDDSADVRFEARLSGVEVQEYSVELVQQKWNEATKSWQKINQLNPSPDFDVDRKGLPARVRTNLPLVRGLNRIEMRVTSELNPNKSTSAVVVSLLLPPRIHRVSLLPDDSKRYFGIEAEVDSATPISEVWVNERRLVGETVKSAYDETIGKHVVRVDKLPRFRDLTEVRVSVTNSDGRSRSIAEKLEPVFFEPPEIQILERPGGAPKQNSDYSLRFSVRSEIKLRSVAVLHNGTELWKESEFPEKIDIGKYVYDGNFDVELTERENTLSVIATNIDDEHASQKVNISYLPPPVELKIDGFSRRLVDQLAPRTPEIPIDEIPSSFESAALWVHGHVRWNQPSKTDRSQGNVHIRAWVNGFQQHSATERNRGEAISGFDFALPILLNQSKNFLKIKADGVPLSAQFLPQIQLDCKQPDRKQSLHLVIIGVGKNENELDQLEEKAMSIFGGKKRPRSPESNQIVSDSQNQNYESSAFENVFVYRNATNVQNWNSLIHHIQNVIRARSNNVANQVIMIYYEGGEMIPRGDRMFVTFKPPGKSSSQWLEDDAFDLTELEKQFARIWGAHVLFLDATQNQAVRLHLDPDSETALFPKAPMRTPLMSALQDIVDAVESPAKVDLNFVKAKLVSKYSNSTDADSAYRPILPEPVANLIIK